MSISQVGTQDRSSRQAILVLGMHRSGTSALAGLLSLLGAQPPKTLIQGDASNERGYWESNVLGRFHDRLLASAGSVWSDWGAFSQTWYASLQAEEYREELPGLLTKEFGDARLFIIKDPRICRISPFWLRVLGDLDIEPKIILPIRNPLEVAQSLNKRDDMPITEGLLLWLRHCLDAEVATRTVSRCFLRYDDLLRDWRGVVEKISRNLDVALPRWSAETQLSADDFITDSLRHNAVSQNELDVRRDVFEWVRGAYAAFEKLVESDGADVSALERLDEIRREFDQSSDIFAPIVFRQRGISSTLTARVVELERHAKERTEQIAVLESERSAGQARADELQNALLRSETALVEKTARFEAETTRLTAAIATERSAGQARVDELQNALFRSETALAEAERIAEAYREFDDPTIPSLARVVHPVVQFGRKIKGLAAPRQILPGRRRKLRKKLRLKHEAELISASGLFSPEWYLQAYPDVAEAGEDPLIHYLQHGVAERRNPNSLFDTDWYLRQYPDVAESGQNPLFHFVMYGAAERRDPGPGFSTEWYLSQNPDVAEAGVDAFWHFLLYGRAEGRCATNEATRIGASYLPEIRPSSDRQTSPVVETSGILIDYVPKSQEQIDFSRCPLRPIAFYLPQFHPIPENDEWWGRGFTEWTNVSKAVPQFIGHYQPHLPGELGFYDLRLVDVMRQQVELAKLYGIAGFCFHYYWFDGKRLLERPIDQFIAAKDIDFPFCFCWANENWTRRWDGMEHDVLIGQSHSPESDVAFINDVIPAMRDLRYIRFNGRPVLIIYRASLLPNAAATAARWRARCIEAGVGDPYLIAARSFDIVDPRPYGFDAAVEFPPHQVPASRLNERLTITNPDYQGSIYDYVELAAGYAEKNETEYPLIKTISPGWDNEARKPGAGHSFYGATPATYATWLAQICATTAKKVANDPAHPPFVFINAWNEWAEGAHLEPDRKYGYAYLHATANVLRAHIPPSDEVSELIRLSQVEFSKRSDTALVVHLHYDDLFTKMRHYISNAGDADLFISIRSDISLERCREILEAFPNARLANYPNRGRDIQPFLETMKLLREMNYEFACKIHGKKSPQRKDGVRLREEAMGDLLGSMGKIEKIMKRFKSNRQLGIVAPHRSLLELGDPNRNVLNRTWLDRLFADLRMMDLVGTYQCNFIAGSMFWFRVEALAKLEPLDLRSEEFENELGQVDGTLAHAVERIFAVCAERDGFVVEEVLMEPA
ncbi:MAG: glycoside hydrolase family 99-like domain-containing protein [Rhizobium sp.]|nr:glycoside hydrolase family 99-like domain-containing protein [Rhizobium sp.]